MSFKKIKENHYIKAFRKEAYLSQDKKCFYCLEVLPTNLATAEHKIPRFKGGKTTSENIICSCADCNTTKGTDDHNYVMDVLHNKKIINVKYIRVWMARRINQKTQYHCERLLKKCS